MVGYTYLISSGGLLSFANVSTKHSFVLEHRGNTALHMCHTLVMQYNT